MPASLDVEVGGWDDGQRIPDRFALGKLGSPMEMSDNISPEISWSGAPDGTRSFAIVVSDPDVPSVADDVNQPDRDVPASLPRITFTHWVLVDLPASMSSISEGAASNGVTARGKRIGESLGGITGPNDYTSWFNGDPDMVACTEATTGRARPGTTRSCITTTSRCSHSTSTRSVFPPRS